MNKFKYFLAPLFIITLLFTGCNKEDPITVDLNEPINDFVWEAMNSWYNWKDDVPNLADEKNDNTDTYNTYLNNYSEPKDLFESLCYQYWKNVGEENAIDRFSWFIEDYVEELKKFQGVTTTTGLRRSNPIKIADNEIIIYAQLVSTGSPADIVGMKRGDIINAIDGEVMNLDNYADVINKLYSGNTIVISTVKEENGTLTKLADFTVTPAEVADNPVYLTKIFDNIDGKKVGYLVYNGFRSTYNDELNAAFATFKGSGITELILDLRINSGGSVGTSAYLASMIYENAGTDTFAELKFNSKHSNENGTYDFGNELNVYELNSITEEIDFVRAESINRLNGITKLYVLISGSTASASEMIINGLTPFIPIKLIGETTYGKNVGSITLYDSPGSDFTSSTYANDSHLNALQPIVFQIYNKLGQSDYTQGFGADIEIDEWMYWRNILPFGDENEVLLKAALDDIKGLPSKQSFKIGNEIIMDEKSIKKLQFENEMYIEGDFFNQQ